MPSEISRKTFEGYSTFKCFETQSLFQTTFPDILNEFVCFSFENIKFDYGFPEHFFQIKKSDFSSDVFHSLRYFGLPTYFIDFNTLLVSKSVNSLPVNRVKILAFKPIDFIRQSALTRPDLYQILVSMGKILFPVFFLNESSSSFELFAFIELTFNSDFSKSKIEFLFFPFGFFYDLKLSLISNGLKDSFENMQSVLNSCFLKGNNPTNDISNQSFKNNKYAINDIFEVQNRILSAYLSEKQQLLAKFNYMKMTFLKNHERMFCVLCGANSFDISQNKWGKKLNMFKKTVELIWNNKQAIPFFQKTIFPKDSFSICDQYPLFEPAYTIHRIPYGNPFKKIVKRKHEYSAYQVSENDEIIIKTIFEDHVSVAANYNFEKRTSLQNFRNHCLSFCQQEFWDNLDSEIHQISGFQITSSQFEEKIDGPNIKKINEMNASTTLDNASQFDVRKMPSVVCCSEMASLEQTSDDALRITETEQPIITNSDSIINSTVTEFDEFVTLFSCEEVLGLKKREQWNLWFSSLVMSKSKRIKSLMAINLN